MIVDEGITVSASWVAAITLRKTDLAPAILGSTRWLFWIAGAAVAQLDHITIDVPKIIISKTTDGQKAKNKTKQERQNGKRPHP